MNKKLLICGAIAAGLLLTACVKKETPKEDEQEQVETAASEATPAEFQQLEVASEPVIEPMPTHTEVIREETANTTTEIRRESVQQASTETPKPSAPVQQAEAQQATTPKPAGTAQSEDDAVAAAIAAATPALDN